MQVNSCQYYYKYCNNIPGALDASLFVRSDVLNFVSGDNTEVNIWPWSKVVINPGWYSITHQLHCFSHLATTTTTDTLLLQLIMTHYITLTLTMILVHPASNWTHWATLRRHLCLSRAATSASSQVNPIFCKSLLTAFLQFKLVDMVLSYILVPASTVGDFTFWLRLSLRLLLSVNFGLRTYLSQKVKWFRWVKTWRLTRIV